jgi:hypothetical protein
MYLILQAIAVQHCQIPSLRGIHTPQLGTFSYQLSILHRYGHIQPITAASITKLAASKHVGFICGFAAHRPHAQIDGAKGGKKKRSERALGLNKNPNRCGGETGERVTFCTAEMYTVTPYCCWLCCRCDMSLFGILFLFFS